MLAEPAETSPLSTGGHWTGRLQTAATASWRGLVPHERFVLVIAGLSPVAWIPLFIQPAAPRVALALALAPFGIYVLVRDAVNRDRAAWLAWALLASALVSTMLSPAPLNSLLGRLDWWTGWVGVAAALAWWSTGRTLSGRARELLPLVLTGGAIWNGLIALAQVTLDVDSGELAGFPGRAAGTMVNPVFYGAFMCGVLSFWLYRLSGTRASYLLVVALAFAAGLSGGRIVLLTIVCISLAAFLVPGRRRIAATNLVAASVGLGLSVVLLAVTREASDRTVGDRVASARGVGIRLDIWEKALQALADRPLVGWGPGNVEVALERQFDLAYTRTYLNDDGTLLRWLDVHNAPLNVLVTLGVVGAVVTLAFVIASLESVRAAWAEDIDRSLLAGSAAIGANWLLQPWTSHTFPIALLLFGSACHRSRRRNADELVVAPVPDAATVHRPAKVNSVMLAGTLLGTALLANLFILDRSIDRGQFDRVTTLARVGYRDSWLDDYLITRYLVAAADADDDVPTRRALFFAERAADAYPVLAAHERVGEVQFVLGEYAEAAEAEFRASHVQPWHPLPYRRLLFLGRVTEDAELERLASDKLCSISSVLCPDATDDVVQVSGD